MKHNAITKSKRTVRGLYKTLAVLVALFGLVYSAQSQTAGLTPKYPFPQNYSYPYGATYMNSGSTAQLQLLYDNWKKNYYEESKDKTMARIKFVQDGETAGPNTVSEGIAYGMLITLWMDGTNKTKDMFDRLFAYYKFNADAMTGVLMDWKVTGFTGNVTAPTASNSNSATDADLDVAATLILAAEQWPADAAYYKAEAEKILDAIWKNEVLGADFHLKPGDAFDNWLNPCYFITNELELFHKFQPNRGWDKVRDKSYAIMKKVAHPSTGLIPDWVNNDATYSYCKDDASNPKFTSYFLYDAIRIPWRLAMAYSWYGHADAKTMAAKTTDWANTKYSGSPASIVDGYFLDGTPFKAPAALASAYPTQGTNHNPCFSGGIGVGGMVDGTKYESWLSATWNAASVVDAWGQYYTNTTQLMYMMYMTGNMPNLTDMQPVFVSAATNNTGSQITVTFSKDLDATSVAASAAGFLITDGYVPSKLHKVLSVKATSAKTFVITLQQAVVKAPYKITYSGTTMTAIDGKVVAPYGPFDVTDNVTNGVPIPLSSRTNSLGSKVYVVMDKEMDESTLDALEFAITVNGKAVTVGAVALNATNAKQLELTITNTPVASQADVIKVAYSGTTLASMAYVNADAFTVTANNMYFSTECTKIDDFSGASAWATWGKGTKEYIADPINTTPVNTTLHFKTGGGDNDIKNITFVGLRDAFNSGRNILTYRILPKTAMTKVRFRLFDKTNALDWGDNQIMDETTAFTATDLDKWTEKKLDLSSFAGGTYPLDGMSIDITPGTADAGEFYIDDIRLCAAVQVPHLLYATTSWDGKTIIAKYNIPVAAPATVAGLTGSVKVGTAAGTPITISSIEAKAGDGTELIFNLASPMTDATAVVTLAYDKATGSIVDMDGVKTESFNTTVTNIVKRFVTSGWYDDFNSLTDYVTLNVGGDYKKTENPTAATGKIAGSLTVDGSTLATTAKYKAVVVAVTDQVWDLSKNPFVKYRYKYDGTAALYIKVQLKDVNGVTADEMATLTATKGAWSEVTVDFSGHFIERYQAYEVGPPVQAPRGVNPTAIVEAQIYLSTSTTTGAAYLGALDFDHITIGNPIRIYDVATSVAQNATVAATANFDGTLYLVPANTNYTVEDFKMAVFNKTATVLTTAKADVAAAIPTTGLPAGDYWVVGYNPSTGGLTAKAAVAINDVTPPKILTTLPATMPYGGTLSITTDEKAMIYVVPAGTAAVIADILTADLNADAPTQANLTGNMTLASPMLLSAIGTKVVVYAVDMSKAKNISLVSSAFTLKDVDAPTYSLAKLTYIGGAAMAVQEVTDVSDVTLYLVPTTAAITDAASIVTAANGIQSALTTATTDPLTGLALPANVSIPKTAMAKAVVGTSYYLYAVDKWGNISARSAKIEIVASTVAVTGVSITNTASPKALSVKEATAMVVTDPAAQVVSATLVPATANNVLTWSWSSTNSDYVIVYPGTTIYSGVIIGKKATPAGAPVKVYLTVTSGLAATPTTVKDSILVTVTAGSTVVLPTKIEVMQGTTAVSKSLIDVAKGATATFTARLTPTTPTDVTYSFVSRSATVASVTAAGVVTANAVGTAWIVVTAGGDPSVKDSVQINVPAIPVTAIAIATPASTTLNVGATLELTANITPATATYQDVTWAIVSSTATGAVSLTNQTNTAGKSVITVNGLKASTSVVISVTSVKYPTITNNITLTVKDVVIPVKSITVNVAKFDLKVKEVTTVAPVITFDPIDASNKLVTWKVKETGKTTTVSGSGIVTAGAVAETGTIVVTSNDNAAAFVEIPYTVSAYLPTAINVTPATTVSVKAGETKSVFTAVSVTPAQADQTLTYSIDKPTVATIDATTGVVTGKTVGTATITVASTSTPTVKTTVALTVNPELLTAITLNKTSLDLIKGQKAQLLVSSVLPTTATDKSVTWSSSSASVTVDATTGQITASAVVTGAIITATAKDGSTVTAKCTVNVAPVVATGVSLSNTSLTVKIGETVLPTITATVTPDSAEVKTVVFTVAPAGVVTISSTGNVATITPGSAEGAAVITATVTGSPALTAKCSVTVVTNIVPVTSVTVTPATKTIYVGDAATDLTVEVLPANATQSVTWSSSAPLVASVVNGKVTALKPGKATITAAGANSQSGSSEITVENRLVASITPMPASISFNALNQTQLLSVEVAPTNATLRTVTYLSAEPKIATVDANGTVTATGFGSTKITISANDASGITVDVPVTVTAATPSSVSTGTVTSVEVNAGEATTLPTATVTMSDGSTNSNVTWSSADETIAKIVNGQVVGVKDGGPITLTATSAGTPAKTTTITVMVKKVAVTSISGIATELTLALDEIKSQTVVINPNNATVQTVSAVSADDTKVSVTVTGKIVDIKGLALTTSPVNVTVTVDGKTAVCAVSVSAIVVPVLGVTFATAPISIERNVTTQKLAYTINPVNATSPVVSFASDAKDVVDVLADGTLVPKKAGTATITITVNGFTDTKTVTILPIAATSLSATQAIVPLSPNGTFDLSKIVSTEPTPNDAVISYTVKSGTSATVDATGNVTASGSVTGATVITLSTGTKTYDVTINVSTIVVEVTSVTVVGSNTITLNQNETATATVEVKPLNATIKTVEWTSSAPTLVTVDPSASTLTATITGIEGTDGPIQVYAKCNGYTATFNVTVLSAAESVNIGGASSILAGGTVNLTAAVGPSTAKQDVTFEVVSGPATIAQTGNAAVVTASASAVVGNEIVVKATATGTTISTTKTITVAAEVIPVESITVTSPSKDTTMVAGDVVKVASICNPVGSEQSVTITTTASDVVSVNATTGEITALKGGTASITITSTDNSAAKKVIKITVTEKVKTITLTGAKEVSKGNKITLTVAVFPSTATVKTYTLSVAPTNIATAAITAKGIEVTGVALGDCKITATATDGSGVIGTYNVKVTKVDVTSIAFTPKNITLNVGATDTIKASVNPSTATNKKLIYTSEDVTKVTVDTNGVIKAIAIGSSKITVKSVDNPTLPGVSFTVTVELVLPDITTLVATSDSAFTLYTSVEKLTNISDKYKAELQAQILVADAIVASVNAAEYEGKATPYTQNNVNDQVLMLKWAMAQVKANAVVEKPILVDILSTELEVEVTVGPNPTSDVITVKGKNIIAVEVVSTEAKIVSQVVDVLTDTVEVSLGGQFNGTYFVKVQTQSGNVTKTIIKQ